MVEKRTPAEWEVIMGIKIVTPNGWKYRHGQLMIKPYHKKISRREFHRRAMKSFIEFKQNKGVLWIR